MENQELQLQKNSDVFSQSNFEHTQRVAKALSSSDLVPKEYKGNLPNTIIALDVALRIGASPLMVMQHLYIVYGKPSWSSTFLIAAINSSGKFKAPLRFEMTKNGGCIAWTIDHTNERLESPEVTMQMAEAEGWVQKNGSKWKTMPELMKRYRAASFFSRLYCPEITMGMQTIEEVSDTTGIVINEGAGKIDGKTELDTAKEKIIAGLESYRGGNKEELKALCVEANKNGNFDMEFATGIAKQIEIEI